MKKINFKYISILLSVLLIFTSFSACKIELPYEVNDNTSSLSENSESDVSENSDTSSEESSKTTINVDDLEDEADKDYEKYEDNTETSTYTTSKWNHDDDKANVDFSDDDGDGRDDETGLDEYLTDPVPEGKPEPVEPEDTTVSGTAKTCTLSIRMDTILNNVDDLDEELKYMLEEEPIKSGAVYAKKQVTFYDGESVFDVLLRETKANGIHMEFSFTPMYNSSYIEGINNFYEFSCGELSGWMYSVNGWYPNYGCSRYQVKQGDVIEWNYTCDLGRDLPGGEWLGGLS